MESERERGLESREPAEGKEDKPFLSVQEGSEVGKPARGASGMDSRGRRLRGLQ